LQDKLSLKGKITDGVVSRYINRRISMKISAFIIRHKIPITPNMVSIISSIIGFISLPLFILGNPILAGIIVQTSSILDGVDGELARYYGLTSKFGSFLDSILDRLVNIIALLGAILYLTLFHGLSTVLHILVYVLAVAGDLMVSYLHARALLDLDKHPVFIGKLPSIASRDVRLFILFIGCISGFIFESLLAIAILSFFYVISKFAEIAFSRL